MNGDVKYSVAKPGEPNPDKWPKLLLFESRYQEVCTTIPDHDLALRLLGSLNKLVIMVGQTGCSN